MGILAERISIRTRSRWRVHRKILQELNSTAASRQRRRPAPAGDPRGGGVRAALGAPHYHLGPEPPYKPPQSPVPARACRRTGARGRLGSRELHLIGGVAAAGGSGASSASGRKRSRRRPRQLLADPNAEAFAGVPADRDQLPDAIPRLFLRSIPLLTTPPPAPLF